MKKRLFVIPILFLALTSFVSAYGSWNFSIGDLFDSVDSETMILGCLFLVFTLFLKLGFSRMKLFKKEDGTTNAGMAGILAALISLLMVYGIHKFGFDIEELLFNIGISEEILGIAIPFILLIGFIVLLWKLKAWAFIIMGLFLIAIAIFTDWVYQKGSLTAIGIGFIVIGIVWTFIRRRKKKGISSNGYDVVKRAGRLQQWKDYREEKKDMKANLREARYDKKVEKEKELRERKIMLKERQKQQKIKDKAHEQALMELERRKAEYVNRFVNLINQNRIIRGRYNNQEPPANTPDRRRHDENRRMITQIREASRKYGFDLPNI